MLTDLQATTLTEIIDIGVGRAGMILGQLVGSRVKLHIPSVGLAQLTELHECLSLADTADLAAVRQSFSGSLAGRSLLLFPKTSGDALARQLIGEDSDITSIDAERQETLTELGNILLNSVLGSLSNLLKLRFDYDVPVYREGNLSDLLTKEAVDPDESGDSSRVLYANAHFDIEAFRVTGNVLIIFDVTSFDQLLAQVDRTAQQPQGA